MARKKTRTVYHTFKRRYLDSDGEEQVLRVKTRCRSGTALAQIMITEAGVRRALELDGQADSQNCAGAVCLVRQKKAFNHPVEVLVDWWRRRVYVQDGPSTSRVYAHYDGVEEMFDTSAGLRRLLKRIQQYGPITVTLYPVKKGQDPRTGKPVHPAGYNSSHTSGSERGPRPVGSELRFQNYLSGRLSNAVAS